MSLDYEALLGKIMAMPQLKCHKHIWFATNDQNEIVGILKFKHPKTDEELTWIIDANLVEKILGMFLNAENSQYDFPINMDSNKLMN